MAKIKEQGRIHDPRLIYISWVKEDDVNYTKWVDQFYEKVKVETFGVSRMKAWRTGDGLPGSFRNVDEFLQDVTDMVAVLTTNYASANQVENSPNGEPELAKFITLRLKDKADSGSKRAWITPLQLLRYRHVRVAGIALSEDRYWLIRLKTEGQKFPWPPDPTYDDEIYKAVGAILGDMDD